MVLTGWTYYKTITITGSSSGAQTDYQMPFHIYYGSGTDGTETANAITYAKVYAGSLCKTDFSDIRFTSSDGTTLYSHWIEGKANSDNAIIWVKISAIPASPSTLTIYMYVGNPDATSTSTPSAMILGESFDPSAENTWTLTYGSNWTSSNAGYYENCAYSQSGLNQLRASFTSVNSPILLFYRMKYSAQNGYGLGMNLSNYAAGDYYTMIQHFPAGSGQFSLYIASTEYSQYNASTTANTWHTVTAKINSSNRLNVYFDGNIYNNLSQLAYTNNFCYLYARIDSTATWIDSILIKKHADTDPTFTAFGEMSASFNGTYRTYIPLGGLAASGWNYRKTIILSGSSSGTVTNYQMCFKVYYGSGNDGTETVNGTTVISLYTNSKCKTDFGDLRFTTSDGSTLLDYWVEEKVDSNYAVVWVEIDSISASPATKQIYLWFGNSSATTASNATNTWLMFENFENTRLAGWVNGNNTTAAKIEYSTTSPLEGSYSLHAKTGRSANAYDNIFYKTTTYSNFRLKALISRNYSDDDALIVFRADGNESCNWNGPSNSYALILPRAGNAFACFYKYGASGDPSVLTNVSKASATGAYKAHILAYGSSLKAYIDHPSGTPYTNLSVTDASFSSGYVCLSFPEFDTNRNPSFDAVCVGNYISPEPSLSSTGSIETNKSDLLIVSRGSGNPAITYKARTYIEDCIFDFYLVDTTDVNASKVRVYTSQGIKAIRRKV